MISKIKKYGLKGTVSRAVRKFFAIICFEKAPVKTMPITSLMTTRTMSHQHHALVVLRFLAVENYYGKNDFGFDLYQRITRNRGIEEKVVEEGKEVFKNLIESIEKNGYRSDSIMYVDKSGALYNGNHRLALCIYHGIDTVRVKQGRTSLKCPTAQEQMEQWGLSEEEKELFSQTYIRMYDLTHKALEGAIVE